MKPRIRKRFGIWSCATFHPFVMGCGYTPASAYSDWEEMRTRVVPGWAPPKMACTRGQA